MMIEIPKNMETVAPEVSARLLVKRFAAQVMMKRDKHLRAMWDDAVRLAYRRLPKTDPRSRLLRLVK